MEPDHILLIDVDGLRPDIFTAALEAGRIPNFASLLGDPSQNKGLLVPVLAPAPSITFASQASLFTGAHPAEHGVPGNQFFDRFGSHSQGVPRHYAFDVGDTLAADDAVRVFTDGLASSCLETQTLYERLNGRGWQSVVVGHMYAKGAGRWIRPALVDLARFTKGRDLFGLSASDYDRRTLDKGLDFLGQYGLPNLFTVYFMGVDHESHRYGPGAQEKYLVDTLDPMVGELWEAIQDSSLAPFCAIFSDHGQIQVPGDDRHSLRLAFPFEREMGHLFDALGLDVHDFPGEDPNCDAVVSSNGGVAHVYLQNRKERWADRPDFERDVLPVGRAFWEAHQTGRYASEIQGALAGVLVRNVEQGGWRAGYQALTPQGDLFALKNWFASQPDSMYIDPVHRLGNLAGPRSGDLLLISNYAEGFYFAAPLSGVHGGLHPEDSKALLAFGWPSASDEQWSQAQSAILQSIQARCASEGGRLPVTADLLTGLWALIG